jgi:transitional endoplasmic reticulum ATPase
MVELPLKHPELFIVLGIEPPRGVLLLGPPGIGKTLLVKAVANESGANLFLINGPEIRRMVYGSNSGAKITDLFSEAERNAPSIIFLDDIESYGELEKPIISQILKMMDSLKERDKIVVIGATNMPNSLDPLLRKSGRFDKIIEINVPDKNGRLSILKIHTRNMPLDKDVNLDELAASTQGFVGADISALIKEAAMNVLRRILPSINSEENPGQELLRKLRVKNDDFLEALKVVKTLKIKKEK